MYLSTRNVDKKERSSASAKAMRRPFACAKLARDSIPKKPPMFCRSNPAERQYAFSLARASDVSPAPLKCCSTIARQAMHPRKQTTARASGLATGGASHPIKLSDHQPSLGSVPDPLEGSI